MSTFRVIDQAFVESCQTMDVIAFHYADPGACGRPGSIRIVTSVPASKSRHENLR